MSTIVPIDDREALPVRALPFITGWMVSPDVVAKTLANTDHWATRLEDVTAYHLLPDGEFAPMLPKEWDGVEAELRVLSERLKASESFEQENYPQWRKQSIPMLPASCFVWKDKFEQAFALSYSPQKLSMIDERLGDRELNYLARIPPEQLNIVMEGFYSGNTVTGATEEADPENLGRRKFQHEIILAVIAALGYERMDIPDGGKARIKSILLNRPLLFTESGFNHAWHLGVEASLFKLKNHNKFSSK